MKILNESNQEISEDQIDYEKGYLQPDKIFVKHHEEILAKGEVWHYAVKTFYFTDGSSYNVTSEEDPHIKKIEPDLGKFAYVNQEGEEPKEVKGIDLKQVVDVERQEGKEAWDEYEDIQRYILYTEEELAENKKMKEEQERQENFMSTGPERLNSAETDIGDLSIMVADMMLATMSS
jgi:hypothetical protein